MDASVVAGACGGHALRRVSHVPGDDSSARLSSRRAIRTLQSITRASPRTQPAIPVLPRCLKRSRLRAPDSGRAAGLCLCCFATAGPLLANAPVYRALSARTQPARTRPLASSVHACPQGGQAGRVAGVDAGAGGGRRVRSGLSGARDTIAQHDTRLHDVSEILNEAID
ncbi:hypothetical protein B0H17DRAFT_1200327 [Mycena rosella]|uniref:Uncharacterized protein n=1 Tax=Mycena rosella TaxID=1033263 RepID=A0AAD7GK28_MYCRO|nr:hypothetical protein B0H17DRAFT_1200327 [Mycena rosella]